MITTLGQENMDIKNQEIYNDMKTSNKSIYI